MRNEHDTRSLLFELQDLVVAVTALLAVTGFGVAGYAWIEGMSFLDALYMTVITLSTVGFGEVQTLSQPGRIFTILLIIVGVSVVVTLSGRLAQSLLDVRLGRLFPRRSMNKHIAELSDHVIVCGYGRFGQMVSNDLAHADKPLVVIEERVEVEHQLQRDGHLYVIGSAASDELLKFAGVERANTVAAATGSDASNVFITLAAKQLNPKVEVFARGESPSTLERLRFAGATKAMSAYQVGAQRMAASILHPAVVDFFEVARPKFGGEIDLEEVRLSECSSLCGRTLAEVEEQLERLRVVGVRRGEGEMELAPKSTAALAKGDRILVVGSRPSVDRLAELASE